MPKDKPVINDDEIKRELLNLLTSLNELLAEWVKEARIRNNPFESK